MSYVFISYSSINQEEAYMVRDYLKAHKIKTWMAPDNIPAGSRYAQVINKALKGCACVVLLLTNEAQNSVWVDKEIERALNYRKNIIPIQVGELHLNDTFEFYISTNQVITMKKVGTEPEKMEKVLTGVRKCIERDSITNESDERALAEYASEKNSSATVWEHISLIGIGGCGCHTVYRLATSRVEVCMPDISEEVADSSEQVLYPRTGTKSIKFVKNLSDAKQKEQQFVLSSKDIFAADCSMEDLPGTCILEQQKYLLTEDANTEAISSWIQTTVTAEKVVILCGLGGETGSRYVNLFAEAAKRAGKYTMVVVYMPFTFENRKRENTFYKLNELKMNVDVDCFAYYDNDSLLGYMKKNSTMKDLYQVVDEILLYAIQKLLEKDDIETVHRRYRIKSRKYQTEDSAQMKDTVIDVESVGRLCVELEEL